MTAEFVRRFALRGPLVVAPLGGGPTTPAMTAASAQAGALGSLAAAYLTPAEITEAIRQVREATGRPFAVNLFVRQPEPVIPPAALQTALASQRPYRAELGLADPDLRPPYHHDFDAQFEAVLAAKPAVFSFIFGLLDAPLLAACRKQGIYTLGTATTVDEAQALVAAGVDAVVAQGREAGGHRGTFSADAVNDLSTEALTRAVTKQVKVPVIAAGGLMDGAGIARALSWGAQAAMLGTAFLLCDEAATSAPYRAALAKPGHKPTQRTRAFSGRWARGIENRFLTEMAGSPAILPFPAQNALTRDLRQQSAREKKADFLSLWAGEGVDAITGGSTTAIIERLFSELSAAE